MLKFGMIGGGLGSYIGKFHRWGAMLDDSAELVCGCFSRSMDKNRATAEAIRITRLQSAFLSMTSTLYATSRLRSALRKPRNLPALQRSAVCCSA